MAPKKKSYSAKSARAGTDIGKRGKNFSKIESKIAKKYGSKAAGKRVAGAALAKLRAHFPGVSPSTWIESAAQELSDGPLL